MSRNRNYDFRPHQGTGRSAHDYGRTVLSEHPNKTPFERAFGKVCVALSIWVAIYFILAFFR